MELIEYIKLNFSNNQSEFARHMGVDRQKVQVWIKSEWIVVGNKLYAPRREIPEIDM
ncbi:MULTISPECIES: hypothetical protein [Yersinia]|uniref:Phage transcriptional regulator n=1 Tax=Yersinia aleksiciae TaxID=263819 RepID=A0A0T9V0R1_YERAE|nr:MULTISPECIES: hypothetical protein [Yersinia]QKJ17488.1 hypothetical protein HRD70_21240 [Yersinia kristensenii]CNL92733.1 Uncharacterised protein [Yersinia aleksiciae]